MNDLPLIVPLSWWHAAGAGAALILLMAIAAVIWRLWREHWPRFSLRMLFVAVTVLGLLLAWVGWNASIVRSRALALKAANDAGTYLWEVDTIDRDRGHKNWPGRPKEVPWIRQLLGDRTMLAIFPKDPSSAEVQECVRLFPEATLNWLPIPD